MQNNLEIVKLEQVDSKQEEYLSLMPSEKIKKFLRDIKEDILRTARTTGLNPVIALVYPDQEGFSMLAVANSEEVLRDSSNSTQLIRERVLPKMEKEIKELHNTEPEFFILISDIIMVKTKSQEDLDNIKDSVTPEENGTDILRALKNSETGLLIHIESKNAVFLEVYAKFYADENYNSKTEFVMSPKPITSVVKQRKDIPKDTTYWKI